MMVKEKIKFFRKFRFKKRFFFLGALVGMSILPLFLLYVFDKKYEGKIYPGVYVDHVHFGGARPVFVQKYLSQKNFPYERLNIEFVFAQKTATLSGSLLDLGFDATLSATQAYFIGRSGNFFSDLYHKYQAKRHGINLEPFLKYKEKIIDDFLEKKEQEIEILPKNALFKFTDGKVSAFQLSSEGQSLDVDETKKALIIKLSQMIETSSPSSSLKVDFVVKKIKPEITIEKTNDLGIRELIGTGYSYFWGSASERIHNIKLAVSKINGLLITPGEVFSLNQALGEVSAQTGYKQAYIIKQGRTVLDDGGGVCQVSTTLFRAALNAGLFVKERRAHAYRVSYYEGGGFSPGIDATVFAPNVDLKIKNNTPAYVLIQSFVDISSGRLTISFYGRIDDRKIEISKVRVWDQIPPPLDEYIDDPNLEKGIVKQIDFAAWGAKTSFDYKVTKAAEILQENTFYSNFRPWQAKFLRGTKE